MVAKLQLPQVELGIVAYVPLNTQVMDLIGLTGVANDRLQHISAAPMAGISPAAVVAAFCCRFCSAPLFMTYMTSIVSEHTSTQQLTIADLVQGCENKAHLASQQLEP